MVLDIWGTGFMVLFSTRVSIEWVSLRDRSREASIASISLAKGRRKGPAGFDAILRPVACQWLILVNLGWSSKSLPCRRTACLMIILAG